MPAKREQMSVPPVHCGMWVSIESTNADGGRSYRTCNGSQENVRADIFVDIIVRSSRERRPSRVDLLQSFQAMVLSRLIHFLQPHETYSNEAHRMVSYRKLIKILRACTKYRNTEHVHERPQERRFSERTSVVKHERTSTCKPRHKEVPHHPPAFNTKIWIKNGSTSQNVTNGSGLTLLCSKRRSPWV